jgi:ectoine hydroxylase-related dioxygenase (phytanoyl-CoA dioxygenase family)
VARAMDHDGRVPEPGASSAADQRALLAASVAPAGSLSPADRSACLDEAGFLVWPRLVPEALVTSHVAAHEAWLDERGRPTSEEWARLPRAAQVAAFVEEYDWHEASPTALEMFYRPELIAFLAGHFGADPVMRAPQTGARHRGAEMHADGFHTPVDPPGAEIRVWVALEDIDPRSGPIYMIPGSHTIIQAIRDRILREHPDLLEAAFAARARHRATDEVPAAFHELGRHAARCFTAEVADRRLPRVVPTLLTGDAAIFRSDVLHGTMPCADETLTRRHALAFFASTDAAWYRDDAWFGPARDRRSEETRLKWAFARNSHGLYCTNWLDA